jgi:hypothetical protein
MTVLHIRELHPRIIMAAKLVTAMKLFFPASMITCLEPYSF